MRTHTCGQLQKKHIAQDVTLCGWVHRRRDLGGLIFLDIRDGKGLTQVIFDPQAHPQTHLVAETVRSEWVLQIQGRVQAREKGQENKTLATGEIEVLAEKITVLNKSQTPPFEIDKDIKNEDLRMEYRYLDLRREKMQKNLRLRHQITQTLRDFFDTQDFLEIETPILVKGTPEGSREYLVPSRVHPGSFYVLPQSPQQLKQLLMVGGVDRYFQIARCFRDEDLRGDRQPEFTQYEIEMSFVSQKDIIRVIEDSFHHLTEKCAPQKEWKKYLKNGRFPQMTWHEAMERFGSDKPDIRFDLELTPLTLESQNCGFGVFENAEYVSALAVPASTMEFSRKDIDRLTQLAQKHGAKGLAWYRVGETSGAVAKNATEKFLETIKTKTGAQKGDMIFFGAGDFISAVEPLGAVRLDIGREKSLADPNDFAYLWVIDFPLFEKKDDGSMASAHHPFTMPHPQDQDLLKKDPLKVRSYAYDIVLNGVELGGGSVRIHDPQLQHQIFEVLGMQEDEIQMKFGHLLKAFQYGCPPHGGCAMGLDRVVMMFADMPNIREVIAFPKNQSAQDMMLGSPAPMPEKELREQNIQVVLPEKKK